MSVGMPAGLYLVKFGVVLRDYFGHIPYQVGSSLRTKTWRDVDVRIMMPDAEFTRRYGKTRSSAHNARLAAVTMAFAALGKQMTGLPIDFQIQPESWANDNYPGQRSALIEFRDERPPPKPGPRPGPPGSANVRTYLPAEGVHLNPRTEG